jgi:hypothetical protein
VKEVSAGDSFVKVSGGGNEKAAVEGGVVKKKAVLIR